MDGSFHIRIVDRASDAIDHFPVCLGASGSPGQGGGAGRDGGGRSRDVGHMVAERDIINLHIVEIHVAGYSAGHSEGDIAASAGVIRGVDIKVLPVGSR